MRLLPSRRTGEAVTGQHTVIVSGKFEFHIFDQRAESKRPLQSRLEIWPQVEQGGSKHIPRDAAEWIEMQSGDVSISWLAQAA